MAGVVGFGVQYGPELEEVGANGLKIGQARARHSVVCAVDIPLMTLHSK